MQILLFSFVWLSKLDFHGLTICTLQWSIWKYKASANFVEARKTSTEKSRLEFFFFKARKLGILIVRGSEARIFYFIYR